MLRKLDDLFFGLITFPFYGLIFGIMLAGGVGAVAYAPLWVIGLSLFFSIFHSDDLKVMDWNGRIIRAAWIFTLTAVIVGAVWLFVPSAEKHRWWYNVLAISIVTLVGSGVILGVIEGIKENSVMPRVDRVIDWWMRLGGN
ncbi:MAG: hypothetical protein AAF490_24845 [Chloroflexota bacterium]